MPTSGAFRIGVAMRPPTPPMLETVKVPPPRSARVILPARTAPDKRSISPARSATPRGLQSRTTGTTSPAGPATATPMFTAACSVSSPASASKVALAVGTSASARVTALTTNGR